MPLGISESTLKAAYGPTDFSGVYNKLDAAAKKYEAEERLRRQADQKEYYTNLAALNKDITGVRAIDLPRVTELYNEFANVSKKQLGVSMSANPAVYGVLENQKRTIQSKIKTISEGSKEIAKQQKTNGEKMLNPSTKYDYEDNAYKSYMEKTNKPYEDVIKDGGYDLSNFFRKDVDVSGLYKNIKNDISTKGVEKHTVDETKIINGVPQLFKNKYDKFPNFDKIHQAVMDGIEYSFKSTGQREAGINQELKKMVDSKEADRINAEFEKKLGDPNFIKKYNIQNYQPLPEPKTNRDRLEALLSKKEFLSNLPTAPSEVAPGEFRSKIEQMQAQAGITRKNIQLAADLRKRAKDAENKDLDSYINKIDKVGSDVASGNTRIASESLKGLQKAAPLGTKFSVYKHKDKDRGIAHQEGLGMIGEITKLKNPGTRTDEDIVKALNNRIAKSKTIQYVGGEITVDDLAKGFIIEKKREQGKDIYKIYKPEDTDLMIQNWKGYAPTSVKRKLLKVGIEADPLGIFNTND